MYVHNAIQETAVQSTKVNKLGHVHLVVYSRQRLTLRKSTVKL